MDKSNALSFAFSADMGVSCSPRSGSLEPLGTVKINVVKEGDCHEIVCMYLLKDQSGSLVPQGQIVIPVVSAKRHMTLGPRSPSLWQNLLPSDKVHDVIEQEDDEGPRSVSSFILWGLQSGDPLAPRWMACCLRLLQLPISPSLDSLQRSSRLSHDAVENLRRAVLYFDPTLFPASSDSSSSSELVSDSSVSSFVASDASPMASRGRRGAGAVSVFRLPDCVTLCAQWSRGDFLLMRNLGPADLQTGTGPAMERIRKAFEDGAQWLASRVQEVSTIEEKAERVSWIIGVEAAAYAKRNFNLVFQCCVALSFPTIAYDGALWKLVPPLQIKEHVAMASLLSDTGNYEAFRKVLYENSPGGAIPFLGIFLSDLLLWRSTALDGAEEGVWQLKELRAIGRTIMKVLDLVAAFAPPPNNADMEQLLMNSCIFPMHKLGERVVDGGGDPFNGLSRSETLHFEFLSNLLEPPPLQIDPLSQSDWDMLCAGNIFVPFEAGEVLLRHDGDLDKFYVVRTGTCQLKAVSAGVSRVVSTLSPGDFFGEEAITNAALWGREQQNQSGTQFMVVALSQGQVEIILRTFVREVMVHRPDVARRFLAFVASRLSERLRSCLSESSPESVAQLSRLSGSQDPGKSPEQARSNVLQDFSEIYYRHYGKIWIRCLVQITSSHLKIMWSLFGAKKLTLIPLHSIDEVQLDGARCIVSADNGKSHGSRHEFRFKKAEADWRENEKLMQGFVALLDSLRTSVRLALPGDSGPGSPSASTKSPAPVRNTTDLLGMLDEDWEALIRCGTVLELEESDFVLRAGQVHRRLYYIVEGECSVFSQGKVVDVLTTGEAFGDASMLLGGASVVDIVASSKSGVQLVVFESYALRKLFSVSHVLAVKFFMFLLEVLVNRMKRTKFAGPASELQKGSSFLLRLDAILETKSAKN